MDRYTIFSFSSKILIMLLLHKSKPNSQHKENWVSMTKSYKTLGLVMIVFQFKTV